MKTLPSWTVAVGVVILLLYMLLALPGEAAMIRAIEMELDLHRRCLDGDELSCETRLLANEYLRAHVLAASDKIAILGPCLVAGDEGVALRCDNVVLDVSGRAAQLLQHR